MRAIINYFSGTGNTFRMVKEYEKHLTSHNFYVQLNNIEENNKVDLNNFDLAFVAYPVYAFNAPKNVIEFAKSITKLENTKPLIIIKTEGEALKMNNISSLKLVKILTRKNLLFQSEFFYCMPYNIIFKHSDYIAYKMYETMKKAVEVDVNKILNNEQHFLSKVFLGGSIARIMRIHHLCSPFLGKTFSVDKACTKCLKCVKRCPTNNIIFKNNKFKFKGKCLTCMRCVFHCPVNAIRLGILDSWRVNGTYCFKKPEVRIYNKNDFFCYKSYQEYFALKEVEYQEYQLKMNQNK